MITKEQADKCNADLPHDAVRTREGPSGRELSYVDGFYVFDTLNAIFGPGAWGYELRRLDVAVPVHGETRRDREVQVCAYTAIVRLTVEGAQPIEDVGYGSGLDRDAGAAIESATKEAVTDAVKRCARALGRRLGLALYDKERSHVSGDSAPREERREAPAREAPSNGNGGARKSGGKGRGVIAFGKAKGVPFDEAETKDLEWYAGVLKKSVNDPEKAKFREYNLADLEAVTRVLKSRGGATPQSEPDGNDDWGFPTRTP